MTNTHKHTQTSKVALITGAGRGIGRALLDQLLYNDYELIAIVRTEADVEKLEQIAAGKVHALCCDITNPDAEQIIKSFVNDKVSKIDLLINNAGFGATGYGIEGLKYEELDRVLAVHLYGPIRCTRAALPLLRKSPAASILNISSRFASLEWVANGVVPHDQATYAYRIAKGAMNMLTSCLAVELQATNIRVLAIDPGKVKTRFGPKDADTEPEAAATAILNLVENNNSTATFLHASGEKLPW